MSFIVSVASALAGEINSDPLVRQAAALGDVYGSLTEMWAEDNLRVYDPWKATSGEQQYRAYIWAAYVRLRAAQQFMDADTAANRWTPNHLPPVSYDQVKAFLDKVAEYRSAAAQLAANPTGRVDTPLEVTFNDWARVEPCPTEHLAAMTALAREMLEQAEAVMQGLVRLDGTAHRNEIGQFEQLFAAAQADTTLALNRYAPIAKVRRVDPEEHEAIEESIRDAFAKLYRLGLCLAMPSLLKVEIKDQPKKKGLPGPGEPGFDKWCLTSPTANKEWRTSRRNPKARDAIDDLWRVDPDPAATLRIHAQIVAAIEEGRIHDTGRYYFCCPWSPIYQAVTDTVINGRKIYAGRTFTFDVSGEELAEGGAFKRAVLIHDFYETDEVDYCSPDGGGHHD